MSERQPRRPAVRKSDIAAAYAAGSALGLLPRSTRFYGDGSFDIVWVDGPTAANDDIDLELAAFEAAHREG